MFKKAISIFLIICTCLCFSACNNTDDELSIVSAPEEEVIIIDEILTEESTATETPVASEEPSSVSPPSSVVEPSSVTESTTNTESTLPIVDDGKIKVMSFNVYFNDELLRSDAILEIINRYSPDIIGVQEATGVWINIFNTHLSPKYGCVGISRDNNLTGEHSAVIYNKEKFNLIEDKTLWLSDTPDTPSKFDNSIFNRIMTYAVLERRSDSKRFIAANTHLDHGIDEVRSMQSAKLMELLSESEGMPIFITGDFNATNTSTTYYNMTSSFLRDSLLVAEQKTTGFTYANKVIDYVFVSRTGIKVNKYRVIPDKINGESPSDHNPVLIEAELT